MTEIWKQDPMLIQFVHEQKLTHETIYRWSQYIIPYKLNNALYLYNTFTKQCIVYDGEFDSNKCYSYKEIENNHDLYVLAKQYYLVPENRDECAFYEGILRIARALLRKEKYSAYTILPTLGCNARCIYCYEEGMKQITMSEEVTQKTIEFILSSCNKNEPVQLTWFGGEPILCVEIIDKICKALSQSEVNFFSTMVSNGSLITEEVVQKMKNDWNLKRIQISMDGDEEEYIHRKNYYAYKDNYIRTIKAVEKMAKEGISVKIRCNVDTGNIDRIPLYIDDMTRYVSNKKMWKSTFHHYLMLKMISIYGLNALIYETKLLKMGLIQEALIPFIISKLSFAWWKTLMAAQLLIRTDRYIHVSILFPEPKQEQFGAG